MRGYIHSIESMGTLDGPGIRTVVFFQGCPLKCKFCHNIDTNFPKQGQEYTPEELFKKVIKNKEYWKNNGGVTISGGEPLLQPQFLLEFLKLLKENNIHTAVDTCLKTSKEVIDSLAPYVDLWMVSLKELDDGKHMKLTGSSNTDILENIKYVSSKKRTRIRFLVIPTLTDSEELIKGVGEFVKSLKNLESLELLAYGSHGKEKWYELFNEYHLENIRDANIQDLEAVKNKLKSFNLEILF
jgi:pyruvate formate lyase activating enzyme